MAIEKRGLTVRPSRPDDAAALADWLCAALLPALGDAVKAQELAESVEGRVASAADGIQVIEESGAAIGVIVMERYGDAVRFPVVTVRRASRERGLGATSLMILDDELQPGTRRFLGALTPGDGRSLYFWLRLGYRRVVLSEGGGRRVWMERRIGDAG